MGGVTIMTQIEAEVREALKLALPVLPDAQKAYLLGFLEGMTSTFTSLPNSVQSDAVPVDRPKKEGKHGGNQSNKKPADCHGQRQD